MLDLKLQLNIKSKFLAGFAKKILKSGAFHYLLIIFLCLLFILTVVKGPYGKAINVSHNDVQLVIGNNNVFGGINTSPTANQDVTVVNNIDLKNWTDYSKFDPCPKNKKALCLPGFTDQFPEGRTMWYPELKTINFKTNLSFIPLSPNKINLAIVFDDEHKKGVFRCLIGNGNYTDLFCEHKTNNYLIEENQTTRRPWINKFDGVKPNSEIFVVLEAVPVTNSENIKIFIEIKFIPKNSDGHYKSEHYKYTVPAGKEASTIKGFLGIELVDPERYQDRSDPVGTEFTGFNFK